MESVAENILNIRQRLLLCETVAKKVFTLEGTAKMLLGDEWQLDQSRLRHADFFLFLPPLLLAHIT
jgi:hypothetical protein